MMKFLLVSMLAAAACLPTLHSTPFPSPWDPAWSPDGSQIAVADRANDRVAIIDAAAGEVTGWLPVAGAPHSVLWLDDARIAVTAFRAGRVVVMDAASGAEISRIDCGGKPMGLARAGDRLWVVDYGLERLIGLPLSRVGETLEFPVGRHPVAVAMDAAGRVGVSGGLLPDGTADPAAAAAVVIFDPSTGAPRATVALPDGSSNLRGLAVTQDGSLAFAVHTRGRIAVPTTQPDRGWINTNAVSVIDLKEHKAVGTFLLDTPVAGAADPWGVAVLPDGKVAITASGTGDLIHFDWPRLRRLMEGRETLPVGDAIPRHSDPGTPAYGNTAAQLWAKIAANKIPVSRLVNDLAAVSAPGLVPRTATGLRGPRALALSPDGTRLATNAFFDGALVILNAENGNTVHSVALSPGAEESLARTGERLFHDASLSFQSWMSCATCHHEGRTDGLNWDLLNDGIGNTKNTKSMLDAPRTPPMTWLGVREDFRLSIRKGMHFFMTAGGDEHVDAIAAYFDSLRAEPSPHLAADGGLSPSARRGAVLFEDIGCADCHSGPLFTDGRRHDVGTGVGLDGSSLRIDTPSLVEIWRTAPYLHNGSAADLREVLTTYDQDGDHGGAADLDPQSLEDLITYLLSL